MNWIVADDGKLIAVDFEAFGWRPVGYELAQLSDDMPVLGSPNDSWGERRALIKCYRDALHKAGFTIPLHSVIRGYQAGLVSRATRLLTNQTADEASRAHGVALLEWVSGHARDSSVRDVAQRVHRAWLDRRAANETDVLSDGRRRHLSRAMAYQLRHGNSVHIDRGGWGYLASVSDALYRDGLATTKDELRLVAGAIDEVRFEISGPKVRATYGHSRPVEIARESTSSGVVLYHGTSTENLARILELREGLLPMGRGWAHLSADIAEAERAARRHGAYTLLRVRAGSETKGFHASGMTHLMAQVDASDLEIVLPGSMLFMTMPSLEIRA